MSPRVGNAEAVQRANLQLGDARRQTMDDQQLNPLKTGILFVAPAQIMDSDIMKRPRYPDHLSRLRADTGIDDLEPTVAPAGRRAWSVRPLLDRIRDLA